MGIGLGRFHGIAARLGLRDPALAARIDDVLTCDKRRRQLETELQRLNADRKRLSKKIGYKKSRSESTAELENEVRSFGDRIAQLNRETAEADEEQRNLLLTIPNLPHEAAPIGTDPAKCSPRFAW